LLLLFFEGLLLLNYLRINVAHQATGYASQHIPVPVPSQDELGGLRQEGHPAYKSGDEGGGC